MGSFLVGCLVLLLRSTHLVLRLTAFLSLLLFRFAASFLRWGAGRGCVAGLLSLAVVVGSVLFVVGAIVSLVLRAWAHLLHLVAGLPHLALSVAGVPWWLAVLVLLVLARAAFIVWATSRTLETRQAWALVPTRSFDVTLPIVELAAEQLGHVQRRLFGWVDRRASALTIRMQAVDGQLLYGWEAPARAASVLGIAARAYHEVELRPLEEELDMLGATARLEGGNA